MCESLPLCFALEHFGLKDWQHWVSKLRSCSAECQTHHWTPQLTNLDQDSKSNDSAIRHFNRRRSLNTPSKTQMLETDGWRPSLCPADQVVRIANWLSRYPTQHKLCVQQNIPSSSLLSHFTLALINHVGYISTKPSSVYVVFPLSNGRLVCHRGQSNIPPPFTVNK